MRGREMTLKGLIKNPVCVLVGVVIVLLSIFYLIVEADTTEPTVTTVTDSNLTDSVETEEIITTVTTVPVTVDVKICEDPDNSVYPYNTMSTDWGLEVYAQGFRYYEIPEQYVREGGCLPEVVQVYLWSLCKERGLDYCTLLALIEKESGYKWDTVGDNGKSFGYAQIQKQWHLDRMADEGVQDITDPYGNLRVCTNYLQEMQDKYGSSGAHCVLMTYNMGEPVAKRNWKKGIYSTEYSRYILQRAEEIRQEIEQD